MGSRKRRRSKGGVAPTREGSAARPAAPAAARPQRPPLSRRRKWLYRLAAMTLVPALFFLALELGLRVFGYGYPTAFFVPIEGRDGLTTNPRFGWRFFPPRLARTPAICEIPAEKPEGTFRIVVLGGSAAMGTPDPAYGFSRYLQVMLEDRFPGRKFEVVNAAMTAINSHVALPIAHDCRRLRPELFVIYMGNNEFVGPFGPGTVFSGVSTSRRLIRASIAIRATRTGQLLDGLLGRFTSGEGGAGEWKGMEMFIGNRVPPGDPRAAAVYDNFRANLRDIVAAARGAGAQVVLCTVAVNLGDCAPFASAHRADLGDDELAEWEAAYKKGIALVEAGKPKEALQRFLTAADIDDRFAELQFRLGQCYADLEEFQAAREHFAAARDCDALRFRADAAVNAAIREVAAHGPEEEVHLVDAERALAESQFAPHGIPGERLFYEHVHLTPEGNHALASAVFAQVAAILAEPAEPDGAAAAAVAPPTFEECRRRLALTAWDRYRLARDMAVMEGRPPFTNQFDHRRRTAQQRAALNELQGRCASRAVLDQAQDEYAAAIQRNPEDLYLRANYAGWLEHRGDYAAAVEQMQKLLARFPNAANWRSRLALLFEAQGKWDEAVAELGKMREIVPQQAATICFDIGTVLLKSGKPAEAAEQFRQALAIRPNYAKAVNSLGACLYLQGNSGEAMEHFRRAMELDPKLATAYNNLGMALLKQGKLDEAERQYRQLVEIDPTNLDAHHALAVILRKRGKPDEAVAQCRAAVAASPYSAAAHYLLGQSQQAAHQTADAVAQYREAIRLDPDHVQALNNLAAMLATSSDAACRDGAEAVRLSRRACALTNHSDPRLLGTLAAAHAEAGQFAEAVTIASKALQIARTKRQEPLAAALQQRLRMFKAGQPVRQR